MALLRRNRLAKLPPPPVVDQSRYDLTDWLALTTYSYGGNIYNLTIPMQQLPDGGEAAPNSFEGYVQQAYKDGGAVFAVSMARALVFSEVRFAWRNLTTKRLFTNEALDLLQHPWPNGTTGEMLLRAEQDVTLAGNFYLRIMPDRLVRMEPNKVKIIITTTDGKDANALNSVVGGYMYYPDGILPGEKGIALPVDEVVHWSPIPDPAQKFIGMSWMTPLMMEVMNDRAATKSKQAFFDHAMTPNFAIQFPEQITTTEQFEKLRLAMERSHTGADNMFKTLYLAAGAKPIPLGVDPKTGGMLDIQALAETRICAAGRVPSVIVGFTTGLEAATYSNFGQARRQFADGFARPQWRSFCAAITKVCQPQPALSELWYDESDVAMLREDAKQAADTTTTHAASIVALVNGGFQPDSVLNAVTSGDLTLLQHTGLMSVQLQAPITADAEQESTAPAEPEQSPADAARLAALDQALIAQRLANGPAAAVGKIISDEEARKMLEAAGAPLDATFEPDEPEPAPIPPTPPSAAGAEPVKEPAGGEIQPS